MKIGDITAMSSPSPPITSEELTLLPPEFQAVVRSLIDSYERQVAELRAELAATQVQLAATRQELAATREQLEGIRKTPRNSSLPPSSEHPHAKPTPSKKTSKRKRGGQPGHPRHERPLIPPEQCVAVHDHHPEACRGCGGTLAGNDPEPLRHQVWDLPEIKPVVTEHRRHRLTCPGCGTVTCGTLPPDVPQGQAGPQLIALTALLMGCFRQSKRKTAQFLTEILRTPCSPGWVVKLQNQATAALRPAYEELAGRLPEEGRLNIDESPSKQGSLKTWLWAFIAGSFSVFAMRLSRKARELYDHVGEDFGGVAGCDRAKMYCGLKQRQWCWAHLIRDFQALVDSSDGKAKRLGHDLMRPVRAMFGLWHRVRDGTLSRADFQSQMQPIRKQVEDLLLRGMFSGNERLIGMCEQLYRGRNHLWTFVDVEGVEPTNNSAERALRHAVIWRKLSFGTQSDAGSRFVETMLTVIETCRQQKRNALDYITRAVTAHFSDLRHPQLVDGA